MYQRTDFVFGVDADALQLGLFDPLGQIVVGDGLHHTHEFVKLAVHPLREFDHLVDRIGNAAGDHERNQDADQHGAGNKTNCQRDCHRLGLLHAVLQRRPQIVEFLDEAARRIDHRFLFNDLLLSQSDPAVVGFLVGDAHVQHLVGLIDINLGP